MNKNRVHPDKLKGAAFAMGAYLSWGLLALYWKMLQHVPSIEVLAHRIFWSLAVCLILLFHRKRMTELVGSVSRMRDMAVLTATSVIIGLNWFVYIWAVNANHIVDASLGYFIAPLTSMLLGVLFLKERLNSWQKLAVLIAVMGVLNQIFNFGAFPWVALSLAFTFSTYSLIRKTANINPMVGMAIEMAILAPVAAGFVIIKGVNGEGALFAVNITTDIFLIGTGIITALPLLWYTHGVKILRLSTMGFFQYFVPTCQLLIGICIYNEPFTGTHLATFGLIWLGLSIYTMDSIQSQRGKFKEKVTMT